MSKPYVICHMMTTVDGKILTANWGKNDSTKAFGKLYEELHNSYESNAWICGRITMEKDFTDGKQPELKPVDQPINREDFVGDATATSFAIAVDAHGKLGWDENTINGDHIIEVLTEKVEDGYLAYLQEKKISYIFGGKDELDFSTVLEKLGKLFPIKTLMLEGGGQLNGSFLNDGLIDELSLLLLPIADGTPKSATVFEVSDYLTKAPATFMKIKGLQQLEKDAVWIKYTLQK